MTARALWVALVVSALSVSAIAAEPSPTGWQFEATPYLFGPGLSGDVKIGTLPAGGVEASFSNVLSVLDAALMATFEGRKDRWGFLADGFLVRLSETRPTPEGVFGDAKVDLTQQIYSTAGTFRVVEGTVSVDVFAGLRGVRLEPDLTLTAGAAQGRHASETRTWLDFMSGARVQYRPAPPWVIFGNADLSGGGSELTWQAVAGAGYRFNKLVSLKFGYRYLSIDYEKDALVYRMTMAGPFVGVGFHF